MYEGLSVAALIIAVVALFGVMGLAFVYRYSPAQVSRIANDAQLTGYRLAEARQPLHNYPVPGAIEREPEMLNDEALPDDDEDKSESVPIGDYFERRAAEFARLYPAIAEREGIGE